jgi:nicotinate-nucleotide pyrophosphorylase (carboxylating)
MNSFTRDIIRAALNEDIGHGDITSDLIVDDRAANANIIAKEIFVLAGMPFVEEVFDIIGGGTKIDVRIEEGSFVSKGDIIARVTGTAKALLAGERTALNILQRLSGIATLTAAFVEKVSGLPVKIVDTRKTSPAMRFMEKYAVTAGGGSNHRFGLFDGILIKDNHISIAGSVKEAIRRAKKAGHLLRIEVEVKDISEALTAVESGADVIMLDNMSVADMKKAVQAVRSMKNGVIIEASGSVRLDNVREIAETGVDIISVGAITHSARAVDISMKITGTEI